MEMTDLVLPGDVLRRELKKRGVKQKDFAKIIGVPYTMLNKFVNGNRPMKADLALVLEKALGTEAMYWLNLQSEYNLKAARQDGELAKRIEQVTPV